MQPSESDQPIGDALPEWTTARRPSGRGLTGRTVRLESLSPTHAEPLYASLSLAAPSHWTYMPWGPFSSGESYAEWVEQSVRADDVEYLAICTPEDLPIGVAGYLNIVPEMGSIEVGGITYSPPLQGTVQATEAMYLMMEHAFDELGYRRYEWKCDALNAPSRVAATRLGFRYEGIFAQHLVVKGRNRDTAWFGLTDKRWRDSVGPALRGWLAPENFDENGGQRQRLQEVRSSIGDGGQRRTGSKKKGPSGTSM